jgi:hypothetical protein
MSTWRRGRRAFLLSLLTALSVGPCAHAEDALDAAVFEAVALEIAAKVDARVAEVLPRIDGTGGKLLALRSYLRSSERLAERWSWSEPQIAAYEGSVEQRELNAEIQRVREVFERSSPGFQLFVNPRVRSLDSQLASWNRTGSVAAASTRLLQDAYAHMGDAVGDVVQAAPMLEAFLEAYVPDPVPTVAAPGLSPHGQMRAIDFQVHRGEEIVAGPDAQSIEPVWTQGGWAARLDRAIHEASQKFIGPLVSPREPWHYTYAPVTVAGQ